MNLRKGFLRLTLVLSLSVAIVSSLVMIERNPYTIFKVSYKVKRTGEKVEELTVTFRWYESSEPRESDFLEVLTTAQKRKEGKGTPKDLPIFTFTPRPEDKPIKESPQRD
jgi:hypothetical protein